MSRRCRICPETRAVRQVLLVPRRLGGRNAPSNRARLCATHRIVLTGGHLTPVERLGLDAQLVGLTEEYRDRLPALEHLYWLLGLRAKRYVDNSAFEGVIPRQDPLDNLGPRRAVP